MQKYEERLSRHPFLLVALGMCTYSYSPGLRTQTLKANLSALIIPNCTFQTLNMIHMFA